jgi:hypothetical protein
MSPRGGGSGKKGGKKPGGGGPKKGPKGRSSGVGLRLLADSMVAA